MVQNKSRYPPQPQLASDDIIKTMCEKNLIVHSDKVKDWDNLRDTKSKDEHLKVVEDVRQKEGTFEITSEQDPASAADFFEPGDTVTLFGQSTGGDGCVTRAVNALQKKGVKTKLSDKPYSTLPWPPRQESGD